MGSGPFKFADYETGQSIKGVRNPDYYHQGQALSRRVRRHLRAEAGDPRSTRSAADRAAIEFRGLPPSARDELKKELGDKIAVQESDWNCGSVVTINHKKKPFDDVRVRRALTLAIDRWHGAPALSKIADRPHRRRHRLPGLARWRRPRKSCTRSPGSGPTSRSRGPRRSGC